MNNYLTIVTSEKDKIHSVLVQVIDGKEVEISKIRSISPKEGEDIFAFILASEAEGKKIAAQHNIASGYDGSWNMTTLLRSV